MEKGVRERVMWKRWIRKARGRNRWRSRKMTEKGKRGKRRGGGVGGECERNERRKGGK